MLRSKPTHSPPFSRRGGCGEAADGVVSKRSRSVLTDARAKRAPFLLLLTVGTATLNQFLDVIGELVDLAGQFPNLTADILDLFVGLFLGFHDRSVNHNQIANPRILLFDFSFLSKLAFNKGRYRILDFCESLFSRHAFHVSTRAAFRCALLYNTLSKLIPRFADK